MVNAYLDAHMTGLLVPPDDCACRHHAVKTAWQAPTTRNPVVQRILSKRILNAKEENSKTTTMQSTSGLFGKHKQS